MLQHLRTTAIAWAAAAAMALAPALALAAAPVTVQDPVTYDGFRANVDTGALISGTTSTGFTTADQTNVSGRGIVCLVNLTALSGTSPTLSVAIQGGDSASGAHFTLLAGTALTATGTQTLTVYPGVTAATGTTASLPLPRTWRISSTVGGTGPSATYTVGCSLIH